MAIEALKEIRDAETIAEDLKKQASLKAKEIVKDAAGKAAVMLNNVVEESRNAASGIIKEKEDKANEKSKSILQSGEMECEALKNISDDKLKKAVDHVIERIVNFHG